VPGEDLAGVEDAVAYIERLRQTRELSKLPIGRRVVAIGGGNTAIDIAVQAKRLGAEDVTIVYRRGPEAMSATGHEQEFAQTNGVRIKHWARPVRVLGEAGQLVAVEFEYTRLDPAGRLIGTGEGFSLEADQIFKAIGQVLVPDPARDGTKQVLEMQAGKIQVDAERHTSLPGVWAGGDCVAGVDLTVQAVQDGKVAAHAIDRWLGAGSR
jgi:glutamate synthase (NADPH/NADH) small chain